jgi:hypothetical protein
MWVNIRMLVDMRKKEKNEINETKQKVNFSEYI